MNFLGEARALSGSCFAMVCDTLSLKAEEVWAVLTVETAGCGYFSQRSPQILFERHKFHDLTKGVFDRSHPDLSNPNPGGYMFGFGEYQRLSTAMQLLDQDLSQAQVEDASLQATSWGLGQVMGMNFRAAGYPDVRSLVTAALASEDDQLQAFVHFLQSDGIDSNLRKHDWAGFARGYNGAAYTKSSYDIRLAAQYARFSVGPLPDLTVRAAQLYLTYLGYKTAGVDGVAGRFTIAALDRFQTDRNLPPQTQINQETIESLRAAITQSPVAGFSS